MSGSLIVGAREALAGSSAIDCNSTEFTLSIDVAERVPTTAVTVVAPVLNANTVPGG
jgi:hypothetical protein